MLPLVLLVGGGCVGVRNNFCSLTHSLEMNENPLTMLQEISSVRACVGSRPKAGLSRVSEDGRHQLQAPSPPCIDGGCEPTC